MRRKRERVRWKGPESRRKRSPGVPPKNWRRKPSARPRENQRRKRRRKWSGKPPEKPKVPPKLPPAVQNQLDSVLQRLEACYPDHTVGRLAQDSCQLSEDVTAVCKLLG